MPVGLVSVTYHTDIYATYVSGSSYQLQIGRLVYNKIKTQGVGGSLLGKITLDGWDTYWFMAVRYYNDRVACMFGTRDGRPVVFQYNSSSDSVQYIYELVRTSESIKTKTLVIPVTMSAHLQGSVEASFTDIAANKALFAVVSYNPNPNWVFADIAGFSSSARTLTIGYENTYNGTISGNFWATVFYQ